ncbi:aminopeptidase P family protein [Oceanospirillum sanctuarii]|uniref:aminopeptidase P family protein n=1 Tax=Oceanospirillum sanctuarii TaxID=1434821 RepID=UPI000A3C2CBC|nr:aminopeptidase P family protein [Oceanospirillum sanctuarii]
MKTIPQRLTALRQLMQEQKLDAYFIPASDPHSSEYLAAHWQGRQWISGFTGTAGAVLVTLDQAGLWTDGRYYIQAEEQLADSGIRLFRAADLGVPTPAEWLQQNLPAGSRVGFDGETLSANQAKGFADKGMKLVSHFDLLDMIWLDRPEIPKDEAFEHSVDFAGLSLSDKLNQLRACMKEQQSDYQLLNALDDIAWLFNLRGTDLPYCPLVLSHALISQESCWLFISPEKLSPQLAQKLKDQGVTLDSYNQCAQQLKQIPTGSVLRLDPAITNYSLFASVPQGVSVQQGQQLTTALKAIKNEVEQAHFRKCMTDDGVAVVRFSHWLDQTVSTGSVTELGAEEKLESYRRMIPGYQQPSFRTIAGYRAHGAKMHYGATPESDCTVEPGSFFLVDSGGQFTNGTTDITRTFSFGELSEQEKTDYTLVLKAHIALSNARFREGCRGTQIDALARAPLWERGIDYACGTGHGVGFFLNVHEGPHSLSQKWIDEPLKPGMTVTIEPGIYREGQYGIRIENTLLVVEDITTEFGAFYRFEPLTLAPICTRPLMKELLTASECDWLNRYHQQVYQKLAPGLNEEERVWLAEQTQAI